MDLVRNEEKFTFKECLEYHKRMWNEIADYLQNTKKFKKIISGSFYDASIRVSKIKKKMFNKIINESGKTLAKYEYCADCFYVLYFLKRY